MVRRMLDAYAAGDVEGAMACADPDIVVRPSVRPGYSIYRGRDGMRTLLAASQQALGEHQMRWSDFVEAEDGVVTATGAAVRVVGDVETVLGRTRARFVVRDGLVTTFDSLPEQPD